MDINFLSILLVHAHMLTMKGCDIDARMDFSLLTCSTCLNRITSEIVMIFRAKKFLLGMSRASTTLPNVPVPAQVQVHECVCVCECVVVKNEQIEHNNWYMNACVCMVSYRGEPCS